MIKLSGLPDPLESRRLRERWAPFLLLFSVALALRLVYAWLATGPGAIPSSDPAEYDQVAWNLIQGRGFSLGVGIDAHATAFVPPVVPWLTSLVYAVFGHDYFAGVLLQCVIGATVPLLVSRLGSLLYGGGIGLFAGWLAAVHPLLIFFSGYLLTEAAFCAALLIALIATIEWVRRPERRTALVAGLCWGLATLTRPTALLIPLLLTGWVWGPLGLSLEPRARIRQLLLVAAGLCIVVVPWTLRNAAVLGALVPVTTGSGRALLDSNNPMAWDDPERRGGAYIDLDAEPYRTMLRGGTEVERDARARAYAWNFIWSRPGDWPAVAWAKFTRFWRFRAEGGGTGNWQNAQSPLGRLLAVADPFLIWSLLVMPLAAWGAVLALRGPRRWFQSMPLWIMAYFTLLALLFWGSLRMRVPIEPLVVLLAALGFDALRRRLRRRRA